jgi:cytoskeletal protein CcmA (bactofilin family)
MAMFGRDKGTAVATPPAMTALPSLPPEPAHEPAAAAPAPASESVFGPTLVFKGEINFQDAIRIEGMIEGRITGEGRVVVAQRGKVIGDIMAAQIIIEGTVQGNITAADRLDILGTAQVAGDLKASKLTVAEGAKLMGRLEIDAESMSMPTATPAPAKAAPAKVNGAANGDALEKVF